MAGADSPSTSPTLLEMLGVPGNGAAWETFLALYEPLIQDRCRKARLQAADAEEVKSRVLTALISAMQGFKYDPARRFRGYLKTVVTNAIRKLWLERARKPGDQAVGGELMQRQLAEVELPPSIEHLGDELDADILGRLRQAERVMTAVRTKVDPATWEAFWRTAVEGQPTCDVAANLRKSVRAVYMAKCRIRRMINDQAQSLNGHADEPADRDP